jgi:hypothetical protein
VIWLLCLYIAYPKCVNKSDGSMLAFSDKRPAADRRRSPLIHRTRSDCLPAADATVVNPAHRSAFGNQTTLIQPTFSSLVPRVNFLPKVPPKSPASFWELLAVAHRCCGEEERSNQPPPASLC